MAQILDSIPVVHKGNVTPPAVPPARLEPPTSLLLPRTVAGRSRITPVPSGRLDWAEIGMIALVPATLALAIYRLAWAIRP